MTHKTLGLILLIAIITSTQPTLADAVITSAQIKPEKGTVDTEILIMVRAGKGSVESKPKYLYVFIEDLCLIRREQSLSWYEYSWDVTIKIPNQPPYSDEGEHRIDVWIDSGSGTFKKMRVYFTIEDAPPLSLDQFPPELIEELRGPPGPRGPKGDTVVGPQGLPGSLGPKGDTVVGPPGPEGVQGLRGEAAPLKLIYMVLALALASMILSIIALKRK